MLELRKIPRAICKSAADFVFDANHHVGR